MGFCAAKSEMVGSCPREDEKSYGCSSTSPRPQGEQSIHFLLLSTHIFQLSWDSLGLSRDLAFPPEMSQDILSLKYIL